MTPSIIKYSPKVVGEILNIVNNGVFLLDSENRILFANNQMAKMFKASAEQLAGMRFENLFMPEDREIMAANILKITKDKKEFECESMLHRLDNSSFLGLMHCAFFHWDGVGLLAVTIHDITKVKSIERMLKHSEHEAFLGHMLNDISHHIRNPVAVIAGMAKRLGRDGPTRKYADTILQESRRLEDLLDRLNAFILLPRPKLNQVSLEEITTEVEKRTKPVVEKHGVSWKVKYSGNTSAQTILIDLNLLTVAVEEAVVNGCESFTDKRTDNTVTLQFIETFEPSLPYAIKIIDNGEGIKAEDLQFVTSHFFTKKSRHIGMGLTFAQRIIDEHDGELSIDSAEGQGTTVTFFLKKERRRSLRTKKY